MEPKSIIKRKLIYSTAGTILIILGAIFLPIELGILVVLIALINVVWSEKVLRHIRAYRSKDIDVILNRSPKYDLPKKILPRIGYWISAIVLVAAMIFILFTAFTDSRVLVFLPCLPGVIVLSLNWKKIIIFDFEHGFITGLYKDPTVRFDNSYQTMPNLRTEDITRQTSGEGIRVFDGDVYFDVFKKDFRPEVWERIRINFEKLQN